VGREADRCGAGIGLDELRELSVAYFGEDLSGYYCTDVLAKIPESSMSARDVEHRCREVAHAVLQSRLHHLGSKVGPGAALPLTVNSKALRPGEPGDLLHIDATRTLQGKKALNSQNWDRTLFGLLQVHDEICRTFGEDHLLIRGRFHLSLGILLGWVFRTPSGFDLKIQQGPEMWATDVEANAQDATLITLADGTPGKGPLFVKVSATHAVGSAVREAVRSLNVRPTAYLRVQPRSGPSRAAVEDNAMCCAMARAIGDAIVERCSYGDICEIHLFMAAPQALAVMIGRQLNALPPVQLYEYDDLRYHPSIRFGLPSPDP